MRSRRRPGPLVRSRHKLRDGRPAAQSRPVQWSQAAETYSGGSSLLLFRCATSKSSSHLWVRAGTNSVAIGELFGCKGNFLSAFWKRQPSIASKSSFAGEWRTCLDRRFADQFRDPRTLPPAVLTAGSPCHLTVRLLWWYPALTPAGGWPVLCAPNSRCRRTGLLGAPLVERWTTRQGAAGAVVPLEPVLCLDKSNTHVHSGTARYVYR